MEKDVVSMKSKLLGGPWGPASQLTGIQIESHTLPMPFTPKVAEDLLLSLDADEPWWISLLRLGAGVASSVFFCDFWHLVQTILGILWIRKVMRVWVPIPIS